VPGDFDEEVMCVHFVCVCEMVKKKAERLLGQTPADHGRKPRNKMVKIWG